jgi:glycosyltransferase involved in cell wall biosynthesis
MMIKSSLGVKEKRISILMSTYQGERHLLEQLESIRSQTYSNWRLFVSDDGSTDNTLPILLDFQASLCHAQMEIVSGPRRGFADNFMSLLLNSSIEGDYFAFCDQDDVWNKDKLAIAVSKLESLTEGKPAVYGSATILVDDKLNVLGKSHGACAVPSFKNALAQNIAGGNTIVLNKKMRGLLLQIGSVEVVSHDWWVYLICTGVGGEFYFDEKPEILYRQHASNLVGANSSRKAKFYRIKQLMHGRYKRWIEININALETAKPVLKKENIEIVEQFSSLRRMPFPLRIVELQRSDIRRQSWQGNLGLYFACLFNLL